MPPTGPDASNSCLPPTSPVIISIPPIASTARGERCMLDGESGRVNKDKGVFAYNSGKLVVVRSLDDKTLLDHSACKLPVLAYRGHVHNVTAVKFSVSGSYMASGDERGILKVWAFDHEEHLCKFDKPGLTGPIRDLDWDNESKKIVLGGERAEADARSDCTKAIQWDTGVTVGQLASHLKGRAASVSFKPSRPFRIVTAGKDDSRLNFHNGPPFARVASDNGIPCEHGHTKGAVNCVRYNHAGTLVVSVSTDRSICIYDGTTLQLKNKLEQAHNATIYCVAWSGDDQHIMTASGDGTCKLFSVASADGAMTQVHEWKVAEAQLGKPFTKVPVGGNMVGCTMVNGDRPICVGLNGQICILPKASESSSGVLQVLTGHSAAVSGLAVDTTNHVFYTGDSDGILCKWDLKTCQPIKRLEPPNGNDDLMSIVHGGAISGLAVTGSGNLLSIGWDDKIYTADTSGQVASNPIVLKAQPNAIATGTKVAVVVTVRGLVVVKDGTASDIISTSYDAKCVCITKDDSTVYVGGQDCKIHIYTVDGMSLKEKHVIENAHLKPIHSMALSTTETMLASGDDRDVCVFDLKDSTYKPIIGRGRWCFHVQRVTCLSWSPDDKLIASGGADDSIYLWSLAKNATRVHYPYAHRGGLTGLYFLQEYGSYKFVSVGLDSVVNQWDAAKDIKDKLS